MQSNVTSVICDYLHFFYENVNPFEYMDVAGIWNAEPINRFNHS